LFFVDFFVKTFRFVFSAPCPQPLAFWGVDPLWTVRWALTPAPSQSPATPYGYLYIGLYIGLGIYYAMGYKYVGSYIVLYRRCDADTDPQPARQLPGLALLEARVGSPALMAEPTPMGRQNKNRRTPSYIC
jgi:hypothetical protein